MGIQRIYVAAEEEQTSDLATGAVKKLFKNRPEIQDRVGVIVLCTQTPDYQLPHASALVHQKLGLKKAKKRTERRGKARNENTTDCASLCRRHDPGGRNSECA